MKKPNIFNYATSELSQDALICYLMEYFNYKENRDEFNLSLNLIKDILIKVDLNIEVNEVKVEKQYKGIDVLLIINKKYYIIIEDKTNTKHHNNQISRYIGRLEKENNINKVDIYGLYFKTGDESLASLEYMKKQRKENYNEYGIMMREDIIKVLKEYNGNNLIINDYIQFLNEKENAQKNYSKYDKNKKLIYDWEGITGFYKKLDKEFTRLKLAKELPCSTEGEIINFSWEYVSNQSGGFMCYYIPDILIFENRRYYLQFEKINVREKNNIGKNTKWSEEIIEYPAITLVIKILEENTKAKGKINKLRETLEILKLKYPKKFEKKEFLKPNRFSNGKTMTQLLINDSIVVDKKNNISIQKTALKILEYVSFLKDLKDELKKLD